MEIIIIRTITGFQLRSSNTLEVALISSIIGCLSIGMSPALLNGLIIRPIVKNKEMSLFDFKIANRMSIVSSIVFIIIFIMSASM